MLLRHRVEVVEGGGTRRRRSTEPSLLMPGKVTLASLDERKALILLWEFLATICSRGPQPKYGSSRFQPPQSPLVAVLSVSALRCQSNITWHQSAISLSTPSSTTSTRCQSNTTWHQAARLCLLHIHPSMPESHYLSSVS